ncbi:hypothetical protein GCM10007939_00550 [Amylibacter marinus]|uniref:YjiS-like domain-containing protein n=1 Tax=Amylibacter marinus TaxID=1475483 RepID=A0ABQ5VR75_9RHOB|nr:DUF1127 domain-containing protein [Amylibacter marinus]GLQ33772.1 hypothetical protein GCM10007939_00550 [Amylibacter marinus]
MATLTKSNRTFGAISTLKVVNKIEATVASFHAWQSAYQTKRVLRKLSARELEDIGLSRADIEMMFQK